MIMEEMWNMRASSMQSSAQPGSSGNNQGFHPDKLRSELVAMVSGSQQHVTRPSFTSSLSGRSPYAASLSQFCQMYLPDVGGYSRWPSQSPSILSQANRGDGGAKTNAGADAASLGGQGRDFRSVMTGGRAQENSKTVNGSRAPAAELLMHSSSSFGRGAEELRLEGSWHLPSSQWSTEPARQRQQLNQSSSWTLFPTNSGDSYNAGVSAPLNASGSSFPSWSHSVSPSTSSGGLRVYCISYFGVPVVGQLGLTDAGRLGVTCSCHGHHMSVATFSQHSGLNAANPGEVVYMEGGDTLVQWRKSFFSQYGVRIPEDSVGWQWLDECPPMAAGHSNVKHKAAVPVTRSWQNDVDVSCGGSTPMMKSRATTRQMWDVPLSNGNASTLHATESISNTKFGLLSGPGNHGGMLDSREAMLKSYGHPHKSMASGLEADNRFHTAVSTHENHYLRAQVNMGATSTSQNMEHHAPMGNEYDGLMNSGGSRYNPLSGQQQNVSGGSVKHVVATRLSESGQESRMREADVSSSFELRLGQPSQQTQAAGTSYSSMVTSSVEHPKSHLFEQVMSKVWDGKLQHNLQQFNPANLPKFSGIPDQSRDEEGTHPHSIPERSVENLENGGVENRGEEQGSAAISTAVSQSPRQLMHSDADGVSELLQEKLMHLESLQNQSEKSSGSEDRLFRRESSGPELLPHTPLDPSRSVALENGTTLESLSLGALEQLSKTTGQRLLDTAIQSSFTYRAMGLDGPAAGATQLNGVVPSTSRAEGQCFGQLDAFGRSNIVSGHRASFLELLVRDQLVQNEPELSCGLAMASATEQDPNLRAFQMRDQPGMAFTKQQQHVAQRLVELGRRSEAEQKLECQTLMTNRNGTERRSKEQQGTVMDKQTLGKSQGGPEAEGMDNPRLGSSTVDNGVMLSSRLSRGHGEGESTDLQPQPPADLTARGLALDAGSPQEGVEVSALSEGDAQCSSLKCGKANSLVKGQAVPRLAGQVCLKEKARLASTFEAARKREGKQHGMKGPAQVAGSDMVVRKCTVDAGQDGMEDVGAEHNAGETPENEDDVLADTAGKGTAGGRGGARTAGKMAGKQKRNTKWKWLGSGGADDGVAKDGSPGGSSFGPDAEPQVTSEIARMGSKKFQRTATNASKRGDLVRACSDEVVPPSKRRKLLVPQRHQQVKATNVTEANLEAAARSLGDGSSKKKAGTTLVIRVPQGVNRQKAKKGMWTKLQQQQQQPKCGTRDWKADAGKEGRAGGEDGRRGIEAGKLSASRVARLPTKDMMEGCGSGSDGAGVIPVTKAIRSPRTPLAGPSPRNGRMVSLSVILNQPSATSPVPRMMENSRAPLQPRLRDDAANPVLRREGTTMHRVSDARVESVSGVTGEQGKEVKSDRGGPSHDTRVAWKATEGIRTRIVQKKVDVQCRIVRSMLELTCKNDDDVHGPGPSSVLEFAEEEEEDDDVAAVLSATGKQQATASAAVQTDGPLRQPGAGAGPGRWRTKSCPFPRGERSARPGVPKKRKVEWQRSGDAQTEVAGKRSSGGAVKDDASEKEGMFVCRVSQVMSSAGSSISKEKLQQGLCEQGFPVRKQVRTSKAKRSIVAMAEGLQAKDQSGVSAERVGFAENQTLRQLQVQGRGQVKGGITGFGVLKRRSELQLLPGFSAKRPRVALGLKKGKDCHVSEIEGSTDSGEQLKSSRQRGSCLEQKKMVDEDRLAGYSKTHNKIKKSQTLDMNGRSSKWRKERGGGGEPGNQLDQGDKCRCDVCGTFSSASYNKLLCCGRCSVKVHQACYGVPKVPKGPWMCRICKFKVSNPICVLCGYGGGAMTRVQKARPLCQALLQTWRELKSGNARASVVVEDEDDDDDVDDDETLLSATTSILLSRARLAKETKASEGESRDCVDVCRDKSSVCNVCRKESPEPGSSGGYGVRGATATAAVVASSGREDWRRSNTVGSIVKDAGAKQWAHMVCTLWMPGTRCLNMGTMGVFDVSGVTASRRKALCSFCSRKGGACIQCRVPKCSTPFHVWCAHEKGLLQSEIVQDGSNKVGFFGKCMSHAFGSGVESEDVAKEDICLSSERSCARTEGYKGRLSLEERATAQHNMHLEGATAVTREQVAEWLRISDRKMNARRVLKSTNPAMKFDNREYLRFKQKKGWRKLTVCKSGIHALGLYTTDFIAEGEVVVDYVGEIVGLRVADKREAEYHSGKRLQHQGACYLFRIDSEQIIDATRKGGIARFVNHSCSPNCVAKVICVDNLKKVIFFAKRDIYAGEEVTYDYKFNYDEVGDKIPCFCGTPECRGTLN